MNTTRKTHRAYRMDDAPYEKAMKRALKNNGILSSLVREWVEAYGKGKDIVVVDPKKK